MDLSNIRFLNGGYCLQSARMAGARSWSVRRFYAVFVAFEHPLHGPCLIDTGYGPALRQAGQSLGGQMMKLILPVPKGQPFEQADYLQRTHGIAAEDISTVFLSHFHADHVGGLSLFPNSTIVYRPAGLHTLCGLSWTGKLQHGFLEQLVAPLSRSSTRTIDESQFQAGLEGLPGIKACDYFQDGSLILIDLPGHALGHTGYLLRGTDGTRILYAVDAFWDVEAWSERRRLPWLVNRVVQDVAAYYDSQDKLHVLAESLQLTPVACHCPQTQERYVKQAAH